MNAVRSIPLEECPYCDKKDGHTIWVVDPKQYETNGAFILFFKCCGEMLHLDVKKQSKLLLMFRVNAP